MFSIVVPCHPPHFRLIRRIIDNIQAFHVTETCSIKEIIFAASETNGDIPIPSECRYPIIIHSTRSKCNAATNRNRGWERATGEWIVFLDSDDVYHVDKLRITYDLLTAHPDADCLAHSYVRHGSNFVQSPILTFNAVTGPSIYATMFPDHTWRERNPERGGFNIHMPSEFTFPVHHGVVTVRKSSHIRFKESLNFGEDGRFCSQHAFEKKIVVTDAVLMQYN